MGCAFALSCVMAVMTSLESCLASLLIGLIFFLAMKRAETSIIQPLCATNFFILFVWMIVPWTAPGKIIWQIGFLNISDNGVWLCTRLTLKANAIILTFLGIMAGMTPMRLGLALRQLHISDKLALLLVFSAQQIDFLKNEWRLSWEASQLKGFVLKSGLHAWATIAAMLAFLLVRAGERAETLHEALLLRGFSGKFPVCCSFRPGKGDFWLVFSTTIAVILLFLLNWNKVYDFF